MEGPCELYIRAEVWNKGTGDFPSQFLLKSDTQQKQNKNKKTNKNRTTKKTLSGQTSDSVPLVFAVCPVLNPHW